ncbi:phosphoglycolate phosphatase [Cohaesibacter sp. ES.047]|uniref:phosphoglycolate phosphatase n=1 Tax=Cohaesibacter sp. ES.047 TaxID=1798205 RepID=UPI000BB73AD3|nr:phosphoglycolate phosphatase [Cohaesibacter sp. ES.047]SNY91642.1 phosphoglycolate phosphatase [Cohaesibacter sp. ES.047]
MAQIVFDLDGTLIDSAPDLLIAANTVLAEEGKGHVSLAQVCAFLGSGTPTFVQRMRETVDIPACEQERLLARYRELYVGAVHRTKLYPGVRKALERLTAAGHDLGICTNKPMSPCTAVLRHLELDTFFAQILGGDSLPVHKPDPAPLIATFDALGAGKQIYVGDSEVDAETARRAGVPFLLFTEGYRKSMVEEIHHTATFEHFDDLPDLITRILTATD